MFCIAQKTMENNKKYFPCKLRWRQLMSAREHRGLFYTYLNKMIKATDENK
jgi:hypothetical protein